MPELTVAGCRYPRHRDAGRDWRRAEGGPVVCGVCHPPGPSATEIELVAPAPPADLPPATSGSPDVEARLSVDAARGLTEEVKADLAATWAKLLRLYQGGAHTALGYSSWADYCAAEFEWSETAAYRTLTAAKVVRALGDGKAIPPDSDISPTCPVGNWPANERVARELSPLIDEPEKMSDAWREALERHGDKPTAQQVRAIVQEKAPPVVTDFDLNRTGRADRPPDPADHVHIETPEEIAQIARDVKAARSGPSQLKKPAPPPRVEPRTEVAPPEVEKAVHEVLAAWRRAVDAAYDALGHEEDLRVKYALLDHHDKKLAHAKTRVHRAVDNKEQEPFR